MTTLEYPLMRKSIARNLIIVLPTVAVVFVLAGGWALVVRFMSISPVLLPAPADVLRAGQELVLDGELLVHIRTSVLRLIAGYSLSILLAVPIAFLFSQVGWLRRFFEPPLDFLRQIPPLAMFPLLILWLGIDEVQKIGIIMLSCFFPIYLNVLGGITQCDNRLKEVGVVAGLSKTALLYRIVLPSALPTIAIGMRIALGQGWRALVGAELIASAAGLGYMIVDAENLARTDIIVVGILVIGVLGLLSDWLARKVIKTLTPWASAQDETYG